MFNLARGVAAVAMCERLRSMTDNRNRRIAMAMQLINGLPLKERRAFAEVIWKFTR